jgi:hypothetical protein
MWVLPRVDFSNQLKMIGYFTIAIMRELYI